MLDITALLDEIKQHPYLDVSIKTPHTGIIEFTDIEEGNKVKDVSGEFKMPVAWAWSAGIAKGTTDTTFEPNATCTRAEIATFLYRAFGGTLK